jgi:hypothetical protein
MPIFSKRGVIRDINPNDEKERQKNTTWSTIVLLVRAGE